MCTRGDGRDVEIRNRISPKRPIVEAIEVLDDGCREGVCLVVELAISLRCGCFGALPLLVISAEMLCFRWAMKYHFFYIVWGNVWILFSTRN